MQATERAVRMISGLEAASTPTTLAERLSEIAEELGAHMLVLRDDLPNTASGYRAALRVAIGAEATLAAIDKTHILEFEGVRSAVRAIARTTTLAEFRKLVPPGEAARRYGEFLDASGLLDWVIVPVVDSALRVGTMSFSSRSGALHADAGAILSLIAPHARAAVARIGRQGADADPGPLSPRERECLHWSSHGKTSAEVATILGMTPRTVDAHVNAATSKLGATSRTHAVATAIRKGYLG